jgi:hypothetical protein
MLSTGRQAMVQMQNALAKGKAAPAAPPAHNKRSSRKRACRWTSALGGQVRFQPSTPAKQLRLNIVMHHALDGATWINRGMSWAPLATVINVVQAHKQFGLRACRKISHICNILLQLQQAARLPMTVKEHLAQELVYHVIRWP